MHLRFIAIYSNRALHEIKLSDEESYLSKVILDHKNFKRLLMYSSLLSLASFHHSSDFPGEAHYSNLLCDIEQHE